MWQRAEDRIEPHRQFKKGSSWSEGWTKDKHSRWTDYRATDGDSRTSKEQRDSSHKGHPQPKGKEVKRVEKTDLA